MGMMFGMLKLLDRLENGWRKLLEKSGMTNGTLRSTDEVVARMISIFDRQVEIPALSTLICALNGASSTASLQGAAIAIDANAVLRIPQHRKSTDIVDYLSTEHSGPIILPGQVIQEYWNNQLAAVDTISSGMQKKFDAFKRNTLRRSTNAAVCRSNGSRSIRYSTRKHPTSHRVCDQGHIREYFFD